MGQDRLNDNRDSQLATAKLESIQRAVQYSFPTAEIEQMLKEIDRGREG